MFSTKTIGHHSIFNYFQQLSSIPRGSGNMKAIAQYCVDFAIEHNLNYIRDDADNVIIYKDATAGYEHSKPIILQGHLDMVCQKTPDCDIDFLTDGLDLYVDGDFIKARGTTLGADNGIAVAIVLAILESNDISHPPIEAVFTTDEETGMNGARALDTGVLKGTRMINLDSETDTLVTVSCAGGSDFVVCVPLERIKKPSGTVTIELTGLKGGHSGTEIAKNRINANMLMGRILNCLKQNCLFDIADINGGDKPNAIPNRCVATLCCQNPNDTQILLSNICNDIKNEISDREDSFNAIISIGQSGDHLCFSEQIKEKIIYTLLCVPNGITEMSASIEGLVQTSLNLGILSTEKDQIILHFALRSNKESTLTFLEQRLTAFFENIDLKAETFGHYPPWEYRQGSPLRDTYCSVYKEINGTDPQIEAIHAGLECGVFAGKINDFDCISVGPTMHDVHTVRERLSIPSTLNFYNLIIKILEKLK